MTTKTDIAVRIAALNAALAEATEECPEPYCVKGKIAAISKEAGSTELERLVIDHKDCQGTGRIARFPEFRQECPLKWYKGERLFSHHDHDNEEAHPDYCDCNGTGWQVCAGGLDGGLARLTVEQAEIVFDELLHTWVDGLPGEKPSAPEILLEGLELVCIQANLINKETKS